MRFLFAICFAAGSFVRSVFVFAERLCCRNCFVSGQMFRLVLLLGISSCFAMEAAFGDRGGGDDRRPYRQRFDYGGQPYARQFDA